MKPDERKFWDLMREKATAHLPGGKIRYGQDVYELSESIGMNAKRAEYLLFKWSDRGWYDYGVNVWFGWMTIKGMAEERK